MDKLLPWDDEKTVTLELTDSEFILLMSEIIEADKKVPRSATSWHSLITKLHKANESLIGSD